MKIGKVKVYNLKQSLEDSQLPKSTTLDLSPNIQLVKTLGKAKTGSGHDCILKGILVYKRITAPQNWWLQFMRYHFSDISSSTSKSHMITEMDIDEVTTELVDERIIAIVRDKIRWYNETKEDMSRDMKNRSIEMIIENSPMGLQLTAGATSNYLQLKTQYHQRKNHKSPHWNEDFIRLTEKLPLFLELIGEKNMNGEYELKNYYNIGEI